MIGIGEISMKKSPLISPDIVMLILMNAWIWPTRHLRKVVHNDIFAFRHQSKKTYQNYSVSSVLIVWNSICHRCDSSLQEKRIGGSNCLAFMTDYSPE